MSQACLTLQPNAQRFEGYRTYRTQAKLPVLGSARLFKKCWAEEQNLVELMPTGQAVCDECTEIGVLKDSLMKRTDTEGKQKMSRVLERERNHSQDHREERLYANKRENMSKVTPRHTHQARPIRPP